MDQVAFASLQLPAPSMAREARGVLRQEGPRGWGEGGPDWPEAHCPGPTDSQSRQVLGGTSDALAAG